MAIQAETVFVISVSVTIPTDGLPGADFVSKNRVQPLEEFYMRAIAKVAQTSEKSYTLSMP